MVADAFVLVESPDHKNMEDIQMKKPKKYGWTWVTWRDLEHGIVQFECYIKSDPSPAGFVWGIACGIVGKKKPVFQVFHSFVHPWARRKGVRSKIQTQLEKNYSAVFTYTGTKDGSAWMRASGFKKLRPWGLWIKDKKQKKKSKKAKKARRKR